MNNDTIVEIAFAASLIIGFTWSNIITRSNGSTWLDYVPSKTGGKHAGGKLTEEQKVAMTNYADISKIELKEGL